MPMPQMEPEQKDAFTSSKINLVERPHFRALHLHKAVTDKHKTLQALHSQVQQAVQVGVFEEARRSHVKRKRKK